MIYSLLRSSDLRKIHHFEHELSLINNRKQIISFSLRSIKNNLSIDFVGWNEMKSNEVAFLDAHIYPKLPESVEIEIFDPMIQLLPQHRAVGFFYKTNINRAVTKAQDDILPSSEFVETALYREVYRKFDARHQLYFHIPESRSRIFFTLTRKSVPFSDRETALMDCLGNAVSRRLQRLPLTFQKSQHFNLLYDSFEADPANTVRLDHQLRVLESGYSIQPLLRFFFEGEKTLEGLPLPIRKWMALSLLDEQSGIQTIALSFLRNTAFRRWDRNLIVTWIKHPLSTHSILSFQEDQAALKTYQSNILHMTRRQRQVYQLIKDGFTKPELIAQRLGISRRTIDGHVQQVMQIIHP